VLQSRGTGGNWTDGAVSALVELLVASAHRASDSRSADRGDNPEYPLPLLGRERDAYLSIAMPKNAFGNRSLQALLDQQAVAHQLGYVIVVYADVIVATNMTPRTA